MLKTRLKNVITRKAAQTTLSHHEGEEATIVANVEGRLVGETLKVPLGDWNNTSSEPLAISCADTEIRGLSHSSDYVGTDFYCWIDTSGFARVAMTPDGMPPYSNKALHRLYWATDTEILYLNMADTWHKIGTLDHTKLHNTGTLTHEQLEVVLNEHTEAIKLLKGLTVNGLDGDIKLVAGTNVTIDTNADTKEITINSTGGSAPVDVYKVVEPDRYYVTDGYIEIPSTVIPMSDTIDVGITKSSEYGWIDTVLTPSDRYFNNSAFINANSPNQWVTGQGGQSYSIPIPPSATAARITATRPEAFTAGAALFSAFFTGNGNNYIKPAYLPNVEKVINFTTLGGYQYIGLYWDWVTDISTIPPVTISFYVPKGNAQLPNWVPSYAKLEQKVDALPKGLEIVDKLTGEEPVGFVGIVNNDVPFIATHLSNGWFKTAMSPFNPIIIYEWLYILESASTSSSYTTIYSKYIFKVKCSIAKISFPFVNIQRVECNGVKYTAIDVADNTSTVTLNNIICIPGGAVEINIVFNSSSPAKYRGGVYTDTIVEQRALQFDDTMFTGSFSLPIGFYYTLDV